MSDWSDGVEDAIRTIAVEQWQAIGGDARHLQADLHNLEVLAGPFGVTQVGVAALSTYAASIAGLLEAAGLPVPQARIDVGIASAWLTRPSPSVSEGWERKRPWSDVSLDYPTADARWIRLQANYPHLRRAVSESIGAVETPEAFATAFSRLAADEAESLIVEGGGAAAATRTLDEWARHPQGAAVAAEPFVDVLRGDAVDDRWTPMAARPLMGVRVLDITRVLAGPTATKFLAGMGAEVLRIDPPGYSEPPNGRSGGDLMLGKRCTFVSLDTDEGRRRFLELLADADVFVHGLRPDALERLGLGTDVRTATRPGLVEVTLDAYGWTGPWAGRRGFDTLVQTSAGFSIATMQNEGLEGPRLLPAQVMDLATGYLLAAAAVRGLTERMTDGHGSTRRLALARSVRHIRPQEEPPAAGTSDRSETGPLEDRVHWSPAGPVRRLVAPIEIDGAPLFWEYPGDPYGSAVPMWVGRQPRGS